MTFHFPQISDLLSTAQKKLGNLLGEVKDAAGTSVETVFNYIGVLENKALTAGTKALHQRGVKVNLTDIADLLKDNIQICIKDDEVKAEAKVLIGNVASCVTNDVETLKKLAKEMQGLWSTAKNLPAAIKDVGAQCSAHANTDVSDESALNVNVDAIVSAAADGHELAPEVTELLETASHHVSKRALWGLDRITKCVKSVFNLGKKELVAIPGEIVAVAADAYKLSRSAQAGIPACVSKKLAENSADISKLALKVGACVAAGVSEGEDLEKVLESSPSLAALRNLAQVSEKLNQLKDSAALDTLSSVGNTIKTLG